jgi:hypothetical protein
MVSTYPFFPPRFLLLGLSITSGGGSGALKPNVDMIFIVKYYEIYWLFD